ncbi:TonB family protein [Puniceicoccaceae bacterium K14]|nr:TonB family protein [Puniceicoccaceae bacterium K14]
MNKDSKQNAWQDLNEPALPRASPSGLGIWAFLGALFLAALLFLLIPVTQMLQMDVDRDLTVREMEITTIAPPKAPPPQEEEQVDKEVEPPELEQSFQELDLQQLELSLNPGIGEALSMGAGSMSLTEDVDIMEQIQQVFQFSDLEAVPSMISTPRFDYPQSLKRRGIRKGVVELEIRIDETGNATVLDVVSSPHDDLTRVARRLVERARFTTPKIDGVSVTVVGNLPLTLEAP